MKSEITEPIFLITSSFNWLKDESKVRKTINEKMKINEDKDKEENSGSKFSLVKCSVLLIKGITEISDDNNKMWENFLKINGENKIYANKILEILLDYKWNTYAYWYFWVECLIFIFYFLLFLINFIYIFPNRASNDSENREYIIVSIIFDVLDFIYFIFYAYREIKQIFLFRKVYFEDFWNLVDIAVIIGSFTSLILDFIHISKSYTDELLEPLKTMVAITFFCLWLRILSYSRGISGTNFLMRLVQRTIKDMLYFLAVIFLLLLAFGSAAFMQQKEFSHSPFYVFNLVYRLILGDFTHFDHYDDEIGTSVTLWVGMLIFSVLLSIIMLNLLISIISDTFVNVSATQKSMRNIELLSFIHDIEKNKMYGWQKKDLRKII